MRVVGRARNLRPEFRGELAMHGRTVHADLFEQSAAHHRHHPAAAGCAGMIGALPRRARETAGRGAVERLRRLILELLESLADVVAQRLEPGARPCLAMLDDVCVHQFVSSRICRNASPTTMAAASATLSERKAGFIGIFNRASAAVTTSSVTPTVSRPNNRMSDAA